MKVGFDAKRYFHNLSGLGNYSRRLISDLSKHQSQIELVLFNVKKIDSDFRVFYKKSPNPLWRSLGIGSSIRKSGVQIFHGLSNELPLDIPKKIGKIVTIHDVIYKQFPNFYPKMDREIYHLKTKWALKQADKIILTSDTTKHNLLEYYTVDESKLVTIYQAVDPELYTVQKSQDLNENPYFFYHSTFNHRKNHINLIKAFALTCNHHNWNLLLCGGKGNTYESLKIAIEQHGMQSRITLKTNVKNAELYQMLANSSCFVYPSFQEGFGIPLMEAAVLKLPMIVSDIPIFRELTNNSVAYFDPSSIEELSNQLLGVTENIDTFYRDYSDLLKKIDSSVISEKLVRIYNELV